MYLARTGLIQGPGSPARPPERMAVKMKSTNDVVLHKVAPHKAECDS